MYSSTFRLALAAILFSLVESQFTSPSLDQVILLGASTTVSWNTTGLADPLSFYLVPGGAVAVADGVYEIAANVTNSGSLSWTPSTTIPASVNYAAIAVDGRQMVVISEIFTISNSSASNSTAQIDTGAEPLSTGPNPSTDTRIVTMVATITTTACLTSASEISTPSASGIVPVGQAKGDKPSDTVLNVTSKEGIQIASAPPATSSSSMTSTADPLSTQYTLTTLTSPATIQSTKPADLPDTIATLSTMTASAMLQIDTQILHATEMSTYTIKAPQFTMTISVPLADTTATDKIIVAPPMASGSASTNTSSTPSSSIGAVYTGAARRIRGASSTALYGFLVVLCAFTLR